MPVRLLIIQVGESEMLGKYSGLVVGATVSVRAVIKSEDHGALPGEYATWINQRHPDHLRWW